MHNAKRALKQVAAKFSTDKYSAGVARFVKAALEAKYFGTSSGTSSSSGSKNKNTGVVFESLPAIEIVGLRTGRRNADERVSERVKILNMMSEAGRAASITEAQRNVSVVV